MTAFTGRIEQTMRRRPPRWTEDRALLAGRLLLAAQLLVALAGIGFWRFGSHGPAALAGPAPTPGPTVPRPGTIEGAATYATARARQWDATARLVYVGEEVDWPSQVPPGPVNVLPAGGWLIYLFANAAGDRAHSLLLERSSVGIVREQVVAYPATLGGPALDLGAIGAGSSAALVAAEAAGGTDFRRACPASRHQTRILLDAPTLAANGEPVWVVAYDDDRHPGEVLYLVRVDATSGKVLASQPATPSLEPCSGS